MKKIIFLLSIALFIASCSSNDFKITGTFPTAPDGTVVYMINTYDADFAIVDSAVINDGRFEFKGGFYERSLRMLLVESEGVGGPVLLEPGVITVNMNKSVVRGGTEGNEILQRFVSLDEQLADLKMMTSVSFIKKTAMSKTELDSLMTLRNAVDDSLMKYAVPMIGRNIGNGLGFYMLTKVYRSLDLEFLCEMLVSVPLYMRSSRYDVMNNYAVSRLAAERHKAKTAVGQQFQDFELPDMNSRQLLLSDIVNANKYTLLQFWASWCAPCRAELPELERIYKKYQKRGFAVVGLSLDGNKGDCNDAIATIGLSFRQLCAPDGGSREVSTAYGVEDIPANVLISSKGTILARNLSPAELDNLLAESLQ